MKRKLLAGIWSVIAAVATGGAGAQEMARPTLPTPAKPDGKPADLSKPVKVFILLGQSNMLGFGKVGPETQKGTLEYFVKTEKKYPFLIDDTGKWTVRNDVRYAFVMQVRGGMQVNANDWLTIKGNIGPEVGFGHVIGQALDEPVLLLKACIGNRSLGWDLLPPGGERYVFEGKVYAGYKDRPDSWVVDPAKGTATEPPPWLDKSGKPIEWYAGKQYDDDVANAKKALADLGKYYPGATKYEVAGFVWWQGHKDQNPAHASRYELNLVNVIKSLRKDFDAPNAMFAIATGCGNPGTSGPGLTIAEAQLAVSGETGKYPEFRGNVKSVDSRPFWPSEADSPSKAGYHYCHNAGTYMEVGLSLGQAMAELLKK